MSTDTLRPPKIKKEGDLAMVHEPSDVIVYQTVDYSRFSMINGNRGLNMFKIKRIIANIEGGNDMLKVYPIQVKEDGNKLRILDGQHRFFICKKLKKPVYYIVTDENKSIADIAEINSNVEKWKPQNFIDCYINLNNDNYIRLQEFLNTYNINIGTSIRLLSFGQPGVEGSDPLLQSLFHKGKFEIKFWDEAVALAELCKQFSAFPYWADRSFVIALFRIRKAGLVPMEDIVAAFSKNVDKLVKQLNQKGYIFNLEQILNIGKHNRRFIS